MGRENRMNAVNEISVPPHFRLSYKHKNGAVKKINTQARATILRKLGLADAAKKKHEPKKVYDKQAGREMPCTKCNKS